MAPLALEPAVVSTPIPAGIHRREADDRATDRRRRTGPPTSADRPVVWVWGGAAVAAGGLAQGPADGPMLTLFPGRGGRGRVAQRSFQATTACPGRVVV